MEQKDQQAIRKPFHRPRLQIYGNIKTITQTTMGGRGSDGGNPPAAGMRTAG